MIAVEIAGEFVTFAAGFLLLIITVGTGMAGWALRELVRLTNAVTKLEQVVSNLDRRDEDHEDRIAALERAGR